MTTVTTRQIVKDMKPLTILIGKNNTGKTRLLRSMESLIPGSSYISLNERIAHAGNPHYQPLSNPTILHQVSDFYQGFFGYTVEVQEGEVFFIDQEGKKHHYQEVSQTLTYLLPVITSCITQPDNLTLLNQPELMLNEDKTGDLAEFMALSNLRKQPNKKLIIETHSQHFLLRLRALIAEGKVSVNDLAIYYFENENGERNITEIKVDGKGDVDYWPKGFFSRALNEAIRIRTAQLAKTTEEVE